MSSTNLMALVPAVLAYSRQPLPHPLRANGGQGRRLKFLASLRKCTLGDLAGQGRPATEGAEKLIQPDLQRSAAGHLEQEGNQDIRTQAAFAREVRGADTMCSNKLLRLQRILDSIQNAGTNFENFPYCEISRFWMKIDWALL